MQIVKVMILRAVVIADTHGRFSQLIEKQRDNLRVIDMVLLLGDIYENELAQITDIFKVPIIGVYGNHDTNDTFDRFHIQNIHKSIYTKERTVFCGFQGSLKYKDSQEFGYTQEESIKECSDLSTCGILISHDGPFGYYANNDVHKGLKGIYKYIKKHKPKTVFFGHQHKNRHFMIGNTDCYNVYGIGIFNIENGRVTDWISYGT